jgi:CheY-like chemotaxis protein
VVTFSSNPPDVLLCDVSMPEEDGFALLRRIRALPARSGGKVPAAVLSAFARPEERADSLAVGFQAHLAKPVRAEELLRTVQQLASSDAISGDRDGERRRGR